MEDEMIQNLLEKYKIRIQFLKIKIKIPLNHEGIYFYSGLSIAL